MRWEKWFQEPLLGFGGVNRWKLDGACVKSFEANYKEN